MTPLYSHETHFSSLESHQRSKYCCSLKRLCLWIWTPKQYLVRICVYKSTRKTNGNSVQMKLDFKTAKDSFLHLLCNGHVKFDHRNKVLKLFLQMIASDISFVYSSDSYAPESWSFPEYWGFTCKNQIRQFTGLSRSHRGCLYGTTNFRAEKIFLHSFRASMTPTFQTSRTFIFNSEYVDHSRNMTRWIWNFVRIRIHRSIHSINALFPLDLLHCLRTVVIFLPRAWKLRTGPLRKVLEMVPSCAPTDFLYVK